MDMLITIVVIWVMLILFMMLLFVLILLINLIYPIPTFTKAYFAVFEMFLFRKPKK